MTRLVWGVLLVICALTVQAQVERPVLDARKLLQMPAEALTCSVEAKAVPGEARIGATGLRVELADAAATAVIESPLLQVEPGKRYKIRVYVKAEAFAPETELDLLVRGHAATTGAPLQPYQKISVADRKPAVDERGQWVTRHLLVETTAETRFVSVLLAARCGPANLVIGGMDVTPGDSEARAVALLMASIREKAATRERVTDRTYVMPRSQLKYGMGRNYLHWWHDRPLFCDRSMRSSNLNVYRVGERSFAKDMELAKLYGMDGFAALTVSEGQLGNYLLASGYLAKSSQPGFMLVPEFWGAGEQTEAYFESYVSALEEAIRSPYSFRVDGKPVITSYIGDGWSVEQLREVLSKLKERVGDTFYFVCDMRHGTPVLQVQKGLLTVEDIEAERARLRRYLDVCDGIMFMGANHVKLYYEDVDYGDSINAAYLRDYLTPMFKSVLAEEPYRHKLLGLSAAVSYVNVRSADAKREDRTRGLRETMKVAVDAQPDFIGFPEWNEFNENTCVSPTVYRSLSSQRIIRYYTHLLRGESPTPNAGDDRRIPNLILSYRRVLKLGETLYLELLNVPDGIETDSYEAQLVLLGLDGSVVREFPPETFTINELKEKTYAVPTTELAAQYALIPKLIIRREEKAPLVYEHGFLHVLLQATWNWNYLCVKQPLRDLLRPAEADFLAEARGEKVTLTGKLEVDEPLSSVEVLRNGVEVYAVDRAHEFKREENLTILMEYIVYRGQDFSGTVQVKGATSLYARPVATDNFGDSKTTGDGVFEVEGTTVRFSGVATRALRGFYLSIPRTDAATAVLDLETNVGQFSLPVGELVKVGRVGKVFEHQFVLNVECFDKLPDLPVPVGVSGAAFSVDMEAEAGPALYHLRAIAKSGRIYRSRPVLLKGAVAEAVNLPVFSDAEKKVVPLEVSGDRVPDLDYQFSPIHGDLLATPAGERWWGELGGGIEYGGPFNRGANYPRSAVDSSPEWVEEDGAWCLQFDGVGQYLSFPQEALPRGAFTVQMQIKPEPAGPQVLLRSHGITVGGFLLKLVDGKLQGAYVDSKFVTHTLQTELEVPVGEWSTIEVVYDLESVRLRVGSSEPTIIPLIAVAPHYAPVVFGGHTKPGFGVEAGDGFFKGRLRSLRLVHAPLIMR